MTSRKHSKINQLLREWPEGTVGTMEWLRKRGVSSKLADWHVRSGWLDRLGPRAFVKGGDRPDWTGGVLALQQQLRLTAHVGGRAALELQGRSHFVPLGRKQILLISDHQERLPNWFVNYDWAATVTHKCMTLFNSPPVQRLASMSCGRYAITLSAPETAIMEVIYLARENFELDHALELMAGLKMLRPSVVQPLLEVCRSIKVKRFFLWAAEEVQAPWLGRLETSRFDLGTGKRRLYKGGRLNTKYGITVKPSDEPPDV